MRIDSRLVSLSLVLLAAACSRDASPLAAPSEPRASTWTRTYTISAASVDATTLQPTSSSGGHVVVERVADATSVATQIGEVESNDDLYSFFKPANYSLRLTAVPTGTGCTFRGWVLGTPTDFDANGTDSNPINMDDLRPYSIVRAEFLC
jgi:hypothetical protein